MAVLDEEGQLFGVVNVIDALVMAAVVTVLLGGLVFVGGATESASDMRQSAYATVAVQGSEVVVGQVRNGTELTTEQGPLVVTDRDRVVRANGSVMTVLRIKRPENGGLFGGTPALSVRPGDQLRTTGSFEGLALRVIRTGPGASLATRSVGVVAHATTDPSTATRVVGRARNGGPSDGPVRLVRVDSFPTRNDTRRLRLGLRVRTLTPERRAQTLDAGTRLTRTATGLGTAARVTVVGQTTPPGSRVDRHVVVEIAELSPAVATTLTRGDRTVATNYPARVINVTERPATLLVTDAEGRVHQRPHPRLRSVTLTLSVPVRQYGGVLWYQSERLRIGRQLTLDTGTVIVTGTVTSVDKPREVSKTAQNGTAELQSPNSAATRQEPGVI